MQSARFTPQSQEETDAQTEKYYQGLSHNRDIAAKYGFNSGIGGSSNNSNGSSGTGTNDSGTSSGSGGIPGLNNLGDFTNQAKDLAQFRLGLDKDQAQFSYGLRNQEADANLGRQSKLEAQQSTEQRALNSDTQGALTGRLNSQLQNQLDQQKNTFNQQDSTINRAVGLASAKLGSI